jgi:hypothetical protein
MPRVGALGAELVAAISRAAVTVAGVAVATAAAAGTEGAASGYAQQEQRQLMMAVFRGGDGLVNETLAVLTGPITGTRPSPPLHELALA